MERTKDHQYVLLEALRTAHRASPHGWVTGTLGLSRHSVEQLVATGLAEWADPSERAELSAYAGRPVVWAARPSSEGLDILLYTEARTRPPSQQPPSPEPEPGRKEVGLLPSEMTMLRLYLSLGGSLQHPPATGLDEAVRAAQFRKETNRWLLHVTEAQIASIAYAFYLEGHRGHVTAANRFSRNYGITYRPGTGTPASTEPATAKSAVGMR
ncbi:DUF6417 family protein [Streptomyces sp. NPDC001250]|uniref:DUF6417 family protein n=1 Tax=Streptomyces sp. NPDC001250 TaxID=3154382 RepID=UPI003323CFDE